MPQIFIWKNVEIFWRHKLFRNVTFPNVKIPKLRKNPERINPEYKNPEIQRWLLTGEASFWLTEMREKALS